MEESEGERVRKGKVSCCGSFPSPLLIKRNIRLFGVLELQLPLIKILTCDEHIERLDLAIVELDLDRILIVGDDLVYGSRETVLDIW